MRRSAFLFFKGLGLLFAILCGIGTAVLGWFDGADWMNIVTYSCLLYTSDAADE